MAERNRHELKDGVPRRCPPPEFFFIIHHFGSCCGGIRTFFLIFSTTSNRRVNSSSVLPSSFSVVCIYYITFQSNERKKTTGRQFFTILHRHFCFLWFVNDPLFRRGLAARHSGGDNGTNIIRVFLQSAAYEWLTAPVMRSTRRTHRKVFDEKDFINPYSLHHVRRRPPEIKVVIPMYPSSEQSGSVRL